jgi:hypothetical protein
MIKAPIRQMDAAPSPPPKKKARLEWYWSTCLDILEMSADIGGMSVSQVHSTFSRVPGALTAIKGKVGVQKIPTLFSKKKRAVKRSL